MPRARSSVRRTPPSARSCSSAAVSPRWSSSARGPTSRCRSRPPRQRASRPACRRCSGCKSEPVEGARLLAHLTALPLRAKLGAAAALLALLAAAAGAFTLTRDARVALFATPLGADQVTEVETRLAAWRIPFAPLADNVRVEPQRRAD